MSRLGVAERLCKEVNNYNTFSDLNGGRKMQDLTNIMLLKDYKAGQDALSEYGDLLSINDLSKIFEVSKNTVYKSIKDGKFGTPIQIGRAYKVPKTYVIKRFFCNYQ